MTPSFWDMVNLLISAFGIGVGAGGMVGATAFFFFFSIGGWLKNWNMGVKVAPFIIVGIVGVIFGYLDIMEYAVITVPIYRLDYYILGSSMVVAGRGLLAGVGIGGLVMGIVMLLIKEEKK